MTNSSKTTLNGLSPNVAQLFSFSSSSVTTHAFKEPMVPSKSLSESPKSSRKNTTSKSVINNNPRQKQSSTFINKYMKNHYSNNKNSKNQKNIKNPRDSLSSGFHSDSSNASSTSTSSSTNSKSSNGSKKVSYVPLAKLNPNPSPKKGISGRGRNRIDSFNELLNIDLGGCHKDKFAGCAPAPAASSLPRPPVSWLLEMEKQKSDEKKNVQQFFQNLNLISTTA